MICLRFLITKCLALCNFDVKKEVIEMYENYYQKR